ncbi:aminodeoxychorismate synthase component I [Marinospirillum sp.]|uniref:aminodeoxychorismate synthase component I n=1 Tax=Marinospirillum sp. TaxID=2183934 RepID=UPI002870258E|nr:aminodeoxychorismate synthase component I [Marinospirillum sp.]MDR9467135.1 aminodeoxychorismate synthase component I [Marinospirillum sp.]
MSDSLRYLQLPFASDQALLQAVRPLKWPALLCSGQASEFGGRFSIACGDPVKQLEISSKAEAEKLNALKLEASNPGEQPPTEIPFTCGWLGYFSYDAGRLFENLPSVAKDDLPLPWVRLGYYTWSLVSDHKTQTTWLSGYFSDAEAETLRLRLSTPAPEESFKLETGFTSNMSAASYRDKFAQVQALLKSGDCYQINLAQRFSASFTGSSHAIWKALSQQIAAPFSAFLDFGDQQLLSLSPERFIQGFANGQVETKPIKGTRPRGITPEQDRAYKEELLNSSKDRAENLMIVDLLRNDLGRVCQAGSIAVPDLFTLESYTNVHHLVSRITGQLADGKQPLDLLKAAFPGGSITGAPKLRAMQIIEELEPCRRSAYCGSIGYIDQSGRMDFNIAIRTFIAAENQLHVWGGGGLVADSNVDEEYAETLHKVARLIRVLEPEFAEGF